jgi:hypothetical protein
VNGETGNISAIAVFCWYEWAMFRDMSIPFPEDNMVLGCNLGPAINVGVAMTGKILKKTRQVVYHSMVWYLTEDEYKSEDMKAKHKAFDENINKVLNTTLMTSRMILIGQIWILLHMICMRTMMRECIPKYQTFMMLVLTPMIAMLVLKWNC